MRIRRSWLLRNRDSTFLLRPSTTLLVLLNISVSLIKISNVPLKTLEVAVTLDLTSLMLRTLKTKEKMRNIILSVLSNGRTLS
jgi:hypothetical protein